MRTLLKIFLFCIGAIAVFLISGLLWFVYYSRDLPGVGALAQFAPTTATRVSDPCSRGASVAIPYDSIGMNLRQALNASEVNEKDPDILTALYRGFTDQEYFQRATLSWQISRTMFCTQSRMLKRQLEYIRVAEQLERRFSRRELFTIYVNRVYFGEDLIGVESASQHYFTKSTDALSVAEAALIAG